MQCDKKPMVRPGTGLADRHTKDNNNKSIMTPVPKRVKIVENVFLNQAKRQFKVQTNE